MRKISIIKLEREKVEDIYLVTAYAQTSDGRQDSSIGAVSIASLKGDALANAMMKAETKAKRRVTLSISGLGMLDETELETIPSAQVVTSDLPQTGDVIVRDLVVPPKQDMEMFIKDAKEITSSTGVRYGDMNLEGWLSAGADQPQCGRAAGESLRESAPQPSKRGRADNEG
jgi:hypothetical protein